MKQAIDPDAAQAGEIFNRLRRLEEDRWLSAHYAPSASREKLLALYAFHSELKRIPTIVSEPLLGEMRLQWFRDALGELRSDKPPRGHPVVVGLAGAGLHGSEIADLIDARINAAARPLYGGNPSDLDALASHGADCDGAVDQMASLLLGADASMAKAARALGAACFLAREGAAASPPLAEEAQAEAREIWGRERHALRNAPSQVMPALAHLYLTPLYLRHGARPFPIRKRLCIFKAVATGR